VSTCEVEHRSESDPYRQEEDIVPGRGIALVTAGVVVVLVAAVAWAWLLAPAPRDPGARRTPPPRQVGPILQTPIAPPVIAGVEDSVPAMPPSRFAWVDRDRGIVAVPIDEAMDAVASGAMP
jgi:hypothetical protein